LTLAADKPPDAPEFIEEYGKRHEVRTVNLLLRKANASPDLGLEGEAIVGRHVFLSSFILFLPVISEPLGIKRFWKLFTV